MSTIENNQFCKLLASIRRDYGPEIAFDPKRLKNILSDLNLKYKNEEIKFMFLINEHQAFIKSISKQDRVTEQAIFDKIEELCGFNRLWTENVAMALFSITGKTLDIISNTWVKKNIAANGLYKEEIEDKEKPTEFDDFLQMALNGNSDAQLIVADCYYFGKGVERDYTQAFLWYQKIASLSNSYVWEQLGVSYYFGLGTEKKYEEAIKWFQKAASDNRAYSQARLGYCYYSGTGVALDYKQAFRLFENAAKNNSAWGMCLMGDCYYYGRGIEKNVYEAFKWYEKSAQQNWVISQAMLGRCYYLGEGVTPDYEKALFWYKKSADNNSALGMSLLGDYYYDRKDYDMALVWYVKSADKDNIWAMRQLGLMYCNGDGCKCDYEMASSWLEKAALGGSDTASDILVQLKMCLPISGSSVKPAICARDIIKGSWGPEREKFMWNNPSTYVIFNSICDNPEYGNERNFVRIKRLGTEDKYSKSLDVSAGDEYIVCLYVHNNISSFFYKKGQGIAHEVRLSVTIPEEIEKGKTGVVRGGIYSKNALPNFIWDSAFLKASEDVKISYIEDTARVHSQGSSDGSILPKEDFFGKGALVSYNIEQPGIISSSEKGSWVYIKFCIRCVPNRRKQTIHYVDGTTYIGEVINGQPDGTGKMIFSDGNLYEGYFMNGKRGGGKGKFTWKSGDIYEGHWVNDLREDEHGYQHFADGSIYDGGWKEGKRDGFGKITWKNGRIYEGYWKNDMRNGKGKMTFPDTAVYDGEWTNDKYSGYGTYTRKDGFQYIGEWGVDSNGYGIYVILDSDFKKTWVYDGPLGVHHPTKG